MIQSLLIGQLVWNLPLLFGLIGIAAFYGLLVLRFTDGSLLSKQPLFFLLSLGLLYITIGSPLTKISHLSFSLHMIQMSIFYFVIPPLFLLGIPNALFQFRPKIRFIHPSINKMSTARNSLVIFSILLFIYHFPIVLTFILQHPLFHKSYTTLLFCLAVGMWWPIVTPDPAQRLCPDRRKRYAFLSGMLLMPACSLFIFSAFLDGTSNPLLAQLTAHLCGPDGTLMGILPSPFNTKTDQIAAGFFMLGIHKCALLATGRIRDQDKKGQTSTGS
ncbi:hypothetical protein BEP19_02845 [Ammoniphilus oxalaticus]|uniref:Cytochrome c oxidase assembly factor CtaG n=1 Tax=Ammoniphilus oxalaticus TaxID=66863 RepID=A0A419SNK4_9BACL|nr:cytochrome c oxidase assembly protein [Ammoniphilus oxalaticus]RKD25884.1 hypothetical protein BEP19_02845 [Ammoniphilus oxalaticus]